MTNSQTRTALRDRDIGYTRVQELIHEWVIGENAERDREIMEYWLLVGLSYDAIADRYMLAHPDMPISVDTVKRVIKKRKAKLFKHFPGE